MLLNISHDIVCSIILKARVFQAKEGVVLPDEDAESAYAADFLQILADHKDDLTYLEVKGLIDDLEKDQQITLVALMYLGRGDFTIEEWGAAIAEAQRGWTDHTAEYLLSKPLLGDFLAEGLNKFGYSCDE